MAATAADHGGGDHLRLLAGGGGGGHPPAHNPAVTGLAALPLSPLSSVGQPRPSTPTLPPHPQLHHPPPSLKQQHQPAIRHPPILPMPGPFGGPTGSAYHPSIGSPPPLLSSMDERHRYHQYERDSAWAEVEKLSGYISRCAMTHPSSTADISRERYHDLYNVALHLLRAIEALDPDLAKPFSRYQTQPQEQHSSSLTQPSSASPPLIQAKSEYTSLQPVTSYAAQSYGRGLYQHQDAANVSAARGVPSQPSRPYGANSSFPVTDSRHLVEIAPRLSPSDPLDSGKPVGIAHYNQSILSGMLAMRGPSVPGQQLIPSSSSSAYNPLKAGEAGDSSTTTTSSGLSAGVTKKKRRRKTQRRDLHCHVCGVTDTPEWRRGPDGDHTLCNACGLHYAKALKKEKEAREKEGRKHSIDMLLNAKGREGTTDGTAAEGKSKCKKNGPSITLNADGIDGKEEHG